MESVHLVLSKGDRVNEIHEYARSTTEVGFLCCLYRRRTPGNPLALIFLVAWRIAGVVFATDTAGRWVWRIC